MEFTSKVNLLLDKLETYETALNIFDVSNKDYRPEYVQASLRVGNEDIIIATNDELYYIILDYLKTKVNKTKKEVKDELEKEIK